MRHARLLVVAVLALSCESPTEARPRYEGPLATGMGTLSVSVPVELLPALLDGIQGPGETSCLGEVARDFGEPRERFGETLTGWRLDVGGRRSGIDLAGRRMRICGTSPDCARNGAWHECLTAAAVERRSCDKYHLIGLCGPIWGPGVNVRCQPC